MVRLARFSAEAFVDAAMALVAEGGPSAASMQAIARKVGAPTGSIYHRFESRSEVLGAAWNAAYASFVATLIPLLRAGRPREAALAILPWVAEDEVRARFLLLNEPVTLFEDSPPPPALREALRSLEDEFDAAFRACLAVRAVTGGVAGEEEMARAKFLIFDGPIALLRPYLMTGKPLPPFVGQMIAELHAGINLTGTDRGRRQNARSA